ncbi:kinesin family member 10, partial [Reticulomyxa filosa]
NNNNNNDNNKTFNNEKWLKWWNERNNNEKQEITDKYKTLSTKNFKQWIQNKWNIQIQTDNEFDPLRLVIEYFLTFNASSSSTDSVHQSRNSASSATTTATNTLEESKAADVRTALVSINGKKKR